MYLQDNDCTAITKLTIRYNAVFIIYLIYWPIISTAHPLYSKRALSNLEVTSACVCIRSLVDPSDSRRMPLNMPPKHPPKAYPRNIQYLQQIVIYSYNYWHSLKRASPSDTLSPK